MHMFAVLKTANMGIFLFYRVLWSPTRVFPGFPTFERRALLGAN